MNLLHLGFDNHIAMNRVIAVANYGSAPVKRLIKKARESNRVIDLTSRRGIHSVIFTDSGHIILGTIYTATIVKRSKYPELG